jgi:8-oxo-dGTP pyrophosphatase MutT (NUDIX family)
MAIMSFNDYLGEEQTFVPAKSFAAGVTIIYNNKILLVHPTGASWQRGTCGIPKGGMETGENPMEAALRELREETGIQLNPAQLNPSPENVEMHTKRGKSTQPNLFCLPNKRPFRNRFIFRSRAQLSITIGRGRLGKICFARRGISYHFPFATHHLR